MSATDVQVDEYGDPLECLDDHGQGECQGPVEYRLRPSDWKSFPRCEHHAERREERRQDSMEMYADSDCIPSWFDPAEAGERWSELD